ncbi:location of vulva defective 1-like [Mytilus trossulus]|uniref:location of vulva defective 1-like n=1 Tax=Mytilus trossulus TaxID=6551 RepID=UPI0030045484
MSWKSASFVVSWYMLHYFYGVPVLTHNVINDYFVRFNCSITDNVSFNTYNTIECASKCISDNICEGFQAYKVSSKSTMCVLFNMSSSIYFSNLSRKTYIKRDLHKKFHHCNEHFNTNTENISPMTDEITSKMKANEISSTPEPPTTSTTKPSSSTRNPTTTFPKEPSTAFTTGLSTTESLTTSTTESTTTTTTEIPTTSTTELSTTSTTRQTTTPTIVLSTYATTELSTTSTNTEKLAETTRETSASPLSTRDTTTVDNVITQGENAAALNEKLVSKQKETQVPTTQISETETTVSTNIDKHYECSVNAAIYFDSKGQIWLFFDKHIQKYTSVNDLTTSNFQRENLADILKDAPAQLDAGYFDGTYTILIKDQTVYTYDSVAGSSSSSQKSTDNYYGHPVPQNIDAVILNSDNDIFLFSDDTVTRIQGKQVSSFSFDNNGKKNYYKGKNHKNKPSKITAATKVDSTRHYFFSGKKISAFKEGKKDGEWEDIGIVSCDL